MPVNVLCRIITFSGMPSSLLCLPLLGVCALFTEIFMPLSITACTGITRATLLYSVQLLRTNILIYRKVLSKSNGPCDEQWDNWGELGASVSEPHTCHVNAIFSVFLSVCPVRRAESKH